MTPANDAIFIHDLNTGRVLDANRKMCDMYGYTVEETRHMDVVAVSEGVSPYAQEDAMQWIEKAAAGTPADLRVEGEAKRWASLLGGSEPETDPPSGSSKVVGHCP